VHGIFLQIAAGVFPQQRHEQVSGKPLSVVRVAAEVHIDSGIGQLLKFGGLMVDDENRF
jgi:hypothetical protein